MLSLCIIVKPTKKEAELLDRCLDSVHKYVNQICITITGESKPCERVANKYGAKVSYYKWNNNFASARNHNFAQADNKYILWLDADDIVSGAKNLPGVISKMEEDKIDAIVMDYLYDFNEQKECIVRHLKTRIVKKDAVRWVGAVHEDFEALRAVKSYYCEDVQIIHLADKEHRKDSSRRNLEIAKSVLKHKPHDPRSYYLMGNASIALGMRDDAMEWYEKFVAESGSDEEKYLVWLMMADIVKSQSIKRAITYALEAFSVRPMYPNAYFKLAELHHKNKNYTSAQGMVELGLQLPIPKLDIIAYNPREYDLYPLILLADIYYDTGKMEKALLTIKKCAEMFPGHKELGSRAKLLTEEIKELLGADEKLKEAEKLEGEDLKKYIEALPDNLRTHPKISYFYNINFIKEKSSGKDLVFVCYPTKAQWNPEETVVGGSEEAVIHLSRELSKLGWNVTVYNNCGKAPKKHGDVWYKPFWLYNYRDKQDVTILWRSPVMADYAINSKRVYLDLHDVMPEAEFTEDRLKKIDRIFVKSCAHRDIFKSIPDSKFVILPNGIDVSAFAGEHKKNPYLILNTASPDRHLDATLDIFEELIEKQPGKPWKLAWFYGWDLFDDWHKDKKDLIEWGKRQRKRFNALMERDRAIGGVKISQEEIIEWYKKASIYLYPTQFYEIDCISVRKAQAAGCFPITSDFAALSETNQYGIKISTKAEKWRRDSTFGDTQPAKYIRALNYRKDISPDMSEFSWPKIAQRWSTSFN